MDSNEITGIDGILQFQVMDSFPVYYLDDKDPDSMLV